MHMRRVRPRPGTGLERDSPSLGTCELGVTLAPQRGARVSSTVIPRCRPRNPAGTQARPPTESPRRKAASAGGAARTHPRSVRPHTSRLLGANSAGQLGDGNTTNSDVPVAVSGLTGSTAIGVALDHACAIVGYRRRRRLLGRRRARPVGRRERQHHFARPGGGQHPDRRDRHRRRQRAHVPRS